MIPLISARELIIILFLILLLGFAFFATAPVEYLTTFIGENYLLSASVFVFLMFISTVIAPIAVLPLLPATAPLLGPWQAALLSVLGWTLGALVAFYISRWGGLPLLRRFMSEERVGRITTLIPEQSAFWWILLLRMLIPVDVLSYALGLITTIRPLSYIVATALGVTPFAFIFAYAGAALLKQQYDKLIGLVGLGIFILIVGVTIMRRQRK